MNKYYLGIEFIFIYTHIIRKKYIWVVTWFKIKNETQFTATHENGRVFSLLPSARRVCLTYAVIINNTIGYLNIIIFQRSDERTSRQRWNEY